MKIPRPAGLARRRASLMLELLVAIVLLAFALLPTAWSISSERKMARRYYHRGIAMELVDGELEVERFGAPAGPELDGGAAIPWCVAKCG